MFAWQATVQDESGNAVLLPVVTVYLENGVTLASIYTEAGTPLPNPLTGTLEGFVQFWANSGTYKIVGADGADQTAVWSVFLDTPLQDAVNAANYAAGIALTAASDSSDSADRAESAADAAFSNADVYPNTAAGLAAVSVGGQFAVVTDVGDTLTRYREDAGPVATEVAKTSTSQRIEKLADALPDMARTLLNGSRYYPINVNTSGEMVAGIDMDTGAFIAVDDRGQRLIGGRDTVIVEVVDAVTIYVIIPDKDPNSTRGIRHTIARRTDVPLNADYWQHYFTYEVQWDGVSWVQGNAIIGSSQTEWALGWAGESGINLGGRAHGHEVFTSFKVFVDGSPVSIASPTTFSGGIVTFLQQSDCFFLDNVELVFKHTTQITIDADGWFDLRNAWETLSSRAVRVWYVGMVGLQRAPLGADPAVDPVRLFNTVYRDPLYRLENLTGEVADVTSKARRYLISGTDGRYSCEAELLDMAVNDIPYSATYLSYPETSNNRIKLYFALILSGSYTPSVSDVITSRGRFRILSNQA